MNETADPGLEAVRQAGYRAWDIHRQRKRTAAVRRSLFVAAIVLTLCGLQCLADGRYGLAKASFLAAAGTAVAASRTTRRVP